MDFQEERAASASHLQILELEPLLQATLRSLGETEDKISTLSALLLTGRPEAIASATASFEHELASVDELLRQCSLKLTTLGLPSFREAARSFHHQGETTQAVLLEGILKQLSRIISYCHAGAKRASNLDRELSRSMIGLRDSDASAGSRLIASA